MKLQDIMHLEKLLSKVSNIRTMNYALLGSHDGEPGQILEEQLLGKQRGAGVDIVIDNEPFELKSFQISSGSITICKKKSLSKVEDIEHAIKQMKNLILVRYMKKYDTLKYTDFFIFKNLDVNKFKRIINYRVNSRGYNHIRVSSASRLIECYESGEEIK